LIKSIAKIEYKIRKEKRKSVLIEVYSNKLKTELSKAYLQRKRLRDSILSPFFHSYIFAMYKNEALWI